MECSYSFEVLLLCCPALQHPSLGRLKCLFSSFLPGPTHAYYNRKERKKRREERREERREKREEVKTI